MRIYLTYPVGTSVVGQGILVRLAKRQPKSASLVSTPSKEACSQCQTIGKVY